mgnify:CR=1 FL=1
MKNFKATVFVLVAATACFIGLSFNSYATDKFFDVASISKSNVKSTEYHLDH